MSTAMSVAVDADPGLPVAQVWDVVEAVWESLLEVWPSPAEPVDVGPDWLTAVVTVDGDWSGAVALSCAPGTARHVSRTMLDLAGDHPDPEPDDVADAVREVVNVLGGNVKALVPGGRALSLPSLTLGPPDLDGDLVGELYVGWPGHVARVGVWRSGDRNR
jgi:chemotaxis protein CheX